MDKIRVSFVAVSLVFVLALIAVRSEGNRKLLETLLGNKVSSFSQDELDQETVKQMWIHCWKKIEYSSKTIPDFRLNHPYEIEKAITNLPPKAQESLLDCLTERNLLLAAPNHDSLSTTFLEIFLDFFSGFSNVPRRNLISCNRPHHRKKPQSTDLPSRKKHPHQPHNPQTAVLPLRKKHPHQHPNQPTVDLPLRKKHHRQHHNTQTPNLPLHKKHQHPHQNPEVPLRKKHPRQHQNPKSPDLPLRKKHPPHHHKPKTNTLIVPKPPPRHRPHQKANSPKTSTQSLSALLASTPRPLLLEPSRTPAPAPTPANVPAPAPIYISLEPSAPSPRFDTSPPPLVAKPAPPKDALRTSPPEREDDTRRYIIMAAVASGVAVLAVVALLLVCCLKRGGNKVDPKDGQKDENPLLNLCVSSMSASADKTQTVENPKEKILKTTTLVNNSTSNSDSLSSSPQAANNNTMPAVPPPPGKKAPPPPPPKTAAAPGPPPPPKGVKPPPPPLGKALPRKQGKSSLGGADDGNGGSDSHKAKLKPFFWDKVSPDQSMVWQELKAGSFQVNEEMMETLFGYTVAEKTKHDERKGSSPPQYITIIDPKKSQNLSILLKALNVTTEEVCDALKEGTELPSELTQTLLKMAPTTEEELKLRLYNGELSMLGPAERFLKSVVEIPFAFKRMESLLFISSVEEEISSINDSFKTLEVACTELKNSRLFLKLLEAVLKTGNRMNDGTYRGDAQAFKLDTLLKLSDVKGTDGKTTLLHFVVQEITRSEGVRAARTLRESQSISSIKSDDLSDGNTPDSPEYYRTLGLNVVSGLTNDLENVKKSAVIDGDAVTNTVYKLGFSLGKIKSFLENEIMGLEEESGFKKRVEDFVSRTEEEIERLVGEEKRIMEMVKGTVDYFYGKGAKNEGLRLFVIVRDFLVILDRVCKEVRSKEAKTPERVRRREALTPSMSSDSVDIRQKLFPAIMANRRDDSSSDDESFSP